MGANDATGKGMYYSEQKMNKTLLSYTSWALENATKHK